MHDHHVIVLGGIGQHASRLLEVLRNGLITAYFKSATAIRRSLLVPIRCSARDARPGGREEAGGGGRAVGS